MAVQRLRQQDGGAGVAAHVFFQAAKLKLAALSCSKATRC
jgi:hypothetical protein